jgi:tRNA dimethylallyltransferase
MFHPDKEPELAAAVCLGGESLPEEVARLRAEGALGHGAAPQASQALGYKQVLAVLDGSDPKLRTMDDAFERTKILTRRFAKQQRTWMRRFGGVTWLDMPDDDVLQKSIKAIEDD